MQKMINSLLIFSLILFSACESSTKKTEEKIVQKKKIIALLKFGTHPVIDKVVDGFQDSLQAMYNDTVKVVVYNGNFDLSTTSLMSKQMVASKPNLLVSVTTPATGQLIGVNLNQFPLVFTFVSNPQDVGYEQNVGIPNTTGLSDQVDYEKSLQLIRTLLPKAKKIGYLVTRSESNAIEVLSGFKRICKKYGFQIVTSTIGHSTDIRIAAQTLAPNVDLLLFGGDNTIASAVDVLISVAQMYSKPTFACDEESIKRGAVGGYSVDYYLMGKETAGICQRILSGTRADSIPIKTFFSANLFINQKMMKELSILVPDSILKKAIIIDK